MYRLTIDGRTIHDPRERKEAYEAVLTSKVNEGSYLDFSVDPSHPEAEGLRAAEGYVELWSDDVQLFGGPVTSADTDMYGRVDVSCRSALLYLEDTVVRPYSTVEEDGKLKAPAAVDEYFEWLVAQHNSRVATDRERFVVGTNMGALLDPNNYFLRSSEQYPTTWAELKEKVIDRLGGYVFLTFDGGENVLSLYADVQEANAQVIDFGVNLLDFVRTGSVDDVRTAVLARGGEPEGGDGRVGLSSLSDGPVDDDAVKRGDVVYSPSAVAKYGYREEVWEDSEALDPSNLLKAAVQRLAKVKAPDATVQAKAVDLALLSGDAAHLEVGQVARIRSKPHGFDEYLMVQSMGLDLNDPGQTLYTMGRPIDTLTGAQSAFVAKLNAEIEATAGNLIEMVEPISEDAKQAAQAVEDLSGRVTINESAIAQGAESATTSIADAMDRVEANIGAVIDRIDADKQQTDSAIADLTDLVASSPFAGDLDAVTQELDSVTSVVRVEKEEGQPVLSLGASSSQLGVTLTNDQLSFTDDASTVAYVNGQSMYITQAHVTDALRFGGLGFIPRSNGNMALKWVGE